MLTGSLMSSLVWSPGRVGACVPALQLEVNQQLSSLTGHFRMCQSPEAALDRRRFVTSLWGPEPAGYSQGQQWPLLPSTETLPEHRLLTPFMQEEPPFPFLYL